MSNYSSGTLLANGNELVKEEEAKLLALENEVCSYGDTVHYAEHPKLFASCKGSYLYDFVGTP